MPKGSSRYLTIEGITPGLENKLKNKIGFRTANFVWKVKFTAPLDASTVNNVNLYVTNDAKVPLKTNIRYNKSENQIEIEPLEVYNSDQSYILHITTKVRSIKGQYLKQPISVKFHI